MFEILWIFCELFFVVLLYDEPYANRSTFVVLSMVFFQLIWIPYLLVLLDIASRKGLRVIIPSKFVGVFFCGDFAYFTC